MTNTIKGVFTVKAYLARGSNIHVQEAEQLRSNNGVHPGRINLQIEDGSYLPAEARSSSDSTRIFFFGRRLIDNHFDERRVHFHFLPDGGFKKSVRHSVTPKKHPLAVGITSGERVISDESVQVDPSGKEEFAADLKEAYRVPARKYQSKENLWRAMSRD